ncbi:hypothetical protein [Nocardioides terrisoli]|uniref:hypothetical protein n=1 Tax=Nocardioides terrisoli TaxID=3388267 RepID=UPI00287B8021|nr:hypothetical protein [Nocardioides marmorisolisilvae]
MGDKCRDDEQLMRHWRIKPPPHLAGTITCMPAAVANKPQITPGLVARAFQRIPLPHPRALVQPSNTTLVNLETIFSTQATPFTRTVTLLGQHVQLAIRPTTFTWTHGDGTTATTTTPGAPYPAKTITYRYPTTAHHLDIHVTITWAAHYRVNNGPTRPVPTTVTTTGPTTTLDVVEATPALSGTGH